MRVQFGQNKQQNQRPKQQPDEGDPKQPTKSGPQAGARPQMTGPDAPDKPEPRHHLDTPFGSHEDLKKALLQRMAMAAESGDKARAELKQSLRQIEAHLSHINPEIHKSAEVIEAQAAKGKVGPKAARRHRLLLHERHRLLLADTVARTALESPERESSGAA